MQYGHSKYNMADKSLKSETHTELKGEHDRKNTNLQGKGGG